MKTWPVKVKIPKYGICEVKETTDKETSRANSKGINYAPRSHGFVNLFVDDIFTAWCGISFAKRRIIKTDIKLPKYIRDIPT